MAVLLGVLGSRTLRRTEQVRLRFEPLWLPGGTTISTISRRRLVHNAGYWNDRSADSWVFSRLLKNSSTKANDVQVCTGDLSRAGRFGKAA